MKGNVEYGMPCHDDAPVLREEAPRTGFLHPSMPRVLRLKFLRVLSFVVIAVVGTTWEALTHLWALCDPQRPLRYP